MSYNKYRWYTKKKSTKKLPSTSPLLDRIRNGDFNISPLLKEGEDTEVEYKEKYQSIWDEYPNTHYIERKQIAREGSRLRNVASLRLKEEGMKDEIDRLHKLRKELKKHFNDDFWEIATSTEMGLKTVEDIYFKYEQLKKIKCGSKQN